MKSRKTIELLERRLFLSAADPSGDEQQTLELINRMRQNPAAELALLENSTDPGVQEGFSFFNVNKATLASQWATLVAVPPLAWNVDLAHSARAHDKLMKADNTQSHQLPGEADLPTRAMAAGYTNYSALGESIFIAATSVFDAHAAFAVDWGDNPPSGIQNPPGHRENIMDAGFSNAGVAILNGPGIGDGTLAGPLVFTEDFGSQFDSGNPYLLGSVYNDTNGDGFYTAGEGMAGVAVQITGTGGTFDTTTLSAGGYQVQVPAGTYSVAFSGGGLAHAFTLNGVVVGSDNVQRDVTPADLFATHIGGVLSVPGTAGADSITATQSGSSIIVEMNGVSESFKASSVQSFVISGGPGRDSITVDPSITIPVAVTGGGGGDSIMGGGGTETLNGGGANDTIIAGAGGDQISGGAGSNDLAGGPGNDLFFAHNGAADTVIGGGGNDTAHVDQGLDSITGITQVLDT